MKQNELNSRLCIVVFGLWAFTLTGAMGLTASKIQKEYFRNYSYFFDPVSYLFKNAVLYERLSEDDRSTMALEEWLNNHRHPLRTAPLVLFAPELLAEPLGHMATALPMLFIFLFLLGYTVYLRTRQFLYSLASVALFCALPIMSSPRYGLGAYWLDLPASFLVGGAGLCLLNSSRAKNLKWLIGFSILTSFAILSRYNAAAFTFSVCAPILAYYLGHRWWNEKAILKPVLLPLGLITILIALLCGYFIVSHASSNIQFYSAFGYGIGHGISESAHFFYETLFDQGYGFLGKPIFVVLTILLIFNLLLFWKTPDKEWHTFIVSIWFAIAIIFFTIFIIRTTQARHILTYSLPFIFLFFVSPMPLSKKLFNRTWMMPISTVFITVAVILGGHTAFQKYNLASSPPPEVRNQKAFDISLATEVSKLKTNIIWNTFSQPGSFLSISAMCSATTLVKSLLSD